MIVDKIEQYLNRTERTFDEALLGASMIRSMEAIKRQLMQERWSSEGRLYMSASTKCPRKVAYTYHGYPAKPMDARATVKFLLGDLAEIAMITLAKIAGCQIEGEQTRLVLPLRDEKEASGRPDGILVTDSGKLILECKSMNGYGFSRFVKEGMDDTWGYIGQINSYMGITEIPRGIFLGFDLEAGNLHEQVIEFDPDLFEKTKKNFDLVCRSTKERLPKRPYKPGEDGKLGIVCAYCEHRDTCWPNLEVTYKSGRPVFKVVEADGQAVEASGAESGGEGGRKANPRKRARRA